MTFDVAEFETAKFPVSKPVAVLTALIIAGFLAWGTWGLVGFYGKIQPALTAAFAAIPIAAWLTTNALWIIGLPAIAVAIGVALCWLVLKLFRHSGVLFMWVAIGLNLAIGIAIIILSVMTGIPFVILVFGMLLWLVVPILFMLFFRGLIQRAARFMEMSAELFFEEKEIILPTVFSMLVLGYLALASLGVFLSIATARTIWGTWLFTQPINALYIAALLAPFYYFIYTFFAFFFGAMNVGIIYIWYRGKDPTFINGIRLATSRLSSIVTFSFYTAIIYFVRALLLLIGRRRGLIGAVVTQTGGLMETIWRGVNYFTLQTLVIENLKAWDAIKRSIYTLFKYIPDVIAKEVFMPVVSRGIGFLFVLAVLGLGVIAHVTLQPVWWLSVGSILLALFAIAVPFVILMKTFELSYNTLLYAWAADQEYSVKGPYRLPKFVEEMVAFIKKAPVTGAVTAELAPKSVPAARCAICKRPIQLEIYRCQSCGALVCREHAKIMLGRIYCTKHAGG